MGRGRLRRGYSLEVIFEEDPDFCSHLDSLDSLSVAFRFGVKEADDTISVDSLVEEYQIRFQNRAKKEQVFRSLDGVWDVRDMDSSSFVEWDEFSTESISKMPPGAESFNGSSGKHGSLLDGAILDGGAELAPSGRRSRVSRRQIVEASWIFDSSDDSSNNDNDNDNDSTSTEVEKEPEPEIQPVIVQSPSGMTVSPPILEDQGQQCQLQSLVTSLEDLANSKTDLLRRGGGETGLPLVHMRLGPVPSSDGDALNCNSKSRSPPMALFGHGLQEGGILNRLGDGADKDTLDSYVSTRTDDTEHAYNFADPFDDTHSVASTNFDSSSTSTSSTGSNGSICTVNGRLSESSSSTIPSVSSSKSTSPCDPTQTLPKFRTNLTIGLQSSSPNSEGHTQDGSSVPIIPTDPSGTKGTYNSSGLSNSKRSKGTNGQIDPSSSLSICTDLKRVRALFEIPTNSTIPNSRKSSCGDESTSTVGSSSPTGQSPSQRLYSKNPASPTNSNASVGGHGVPKKLKQVGQLNQNQIVNKVLRSAYSQFNLSQPSGGGGTGNGNGSGGNYGTGARAHLMDFAELLVNDNVVIEDNPDLFQTLRKRHREAQSSHAHGSSTLRRSKSMGAGISGLGGDSTFDKLQGIKTSRTSILAEEMPAPDTVKNVRTVFEQMLKMRSSSASQAKDASILQNGNSLSGFNNNNNSFSIIKKSLSSVKSNPTSKIYRSESMRDDFPTTGSSSLMMIAPRYGKPVLVTDNPLPCFGSTTGSSRPTDLCEGRELLTAGPKVALRKHAVVERKYSEPIKFSPKINSPVSARFRPGEMVTQLQQPLTEEDLSMLSIASSLNDSDNPPKFVSPDVLQRIRSWGTSTTYFGGEIVARTVKNRKLPAVRRHTVMDFQDFNPHDYASPSSSSGTTPTGFRNENGYDYNDPMASPVTRRSGEGRSPNQKRDTNQRISPMDLDSIFAGVSGLLGSNRGIDTKPRIISVVPKSPSQSGSPTKSSSPVGSLIEGRNTPEGCESQDDKCIWINEIPVEDEIPEGVCTKTDPIPDGNNNEIVVESATGKPTGFNQAGIDKQFSQAAEGAWF